MKQAWIITIIFSIALLAACSPGAQPSMGDTVTVPGGTYTNISPAELNTLLEAKDFLLINVHIPFEGDLPGTDLSIPYNAVAEHAGQLPADRDARIVVYCKSGPMSDIAAEALLELGYTNLYNLEGGFIAWQAEGLPLAD